MVRWNESSGWEPLGTEAEVGVNVKINTISFSKELEGSNKIYAGGNFTRAGQVNTTDFAQWQSDNLLSTTVPTPTELIIYPNPTKDLIYFPGAYRYRITDATGKLIKSGEGTNCSIEQLDRGLYFLTLAGGTTFKVIKD
jgi:hypothetical protein